MDFARVLSLLLLSSLMASCRIIQEVPAGGRVVSRSGAADCGPLASCTVHIAPGVSYAETFTGVPDEGYSFVGWKPAVPGEYASLCGGSTGECVVTVPADWTSLSVDTYLLPVFRSLNNPRTMSELVLAEQNMIWQDITGMDLNGDGFRDLIVQGTAADPAYEGNYIFALLNNLDGTFTDVSDRYFPGYDGSRWNWASRTFLVDLNNDGRLDLVPYGTGTVPPLIRQASGAFLQLGGTSAGEENSASVPMDIDSDGDIDLLKLTFGWDEELDPDIELETLTAIRLLENITTSSDRPTFIERPGAINDDLLAGWDNNTLMRMPLVSDINQDGYPDLIYQGPHYEDGWTGREMPVIVFLNSGDKRLIESGEQVFDGAVPKLIHNADIEAADIDGSGFESIILANHGFDVSPWPGEPNLVLRNRGNGKLEADPGTADSHDYVGYTHSMSVGDIDKDGDIDIVYVGPGQDVDEYVVSLGEGMGTAIRTEAIRILLNDGQGTFTNQNFVWKGPFNSGDGWTTNALIDLNNDGFPELILGESHPGARSFVLWNQGGSFTTSLTPES